MIPPEVGYQFRPAGGVRQASHRARSICGIENRGVLRGKLPVRPNREEFRGLPGFTLGSIECLHVYWRGGGGQNTLPWCSMLDEEDPKGKTTLGELVLDQDNIVTQGNS